MGSKSEYDENNNPTQNNSNKNTESSGKLKLQEKLKRTYNKILSIIIVFQVLMVLISALYIDVLYLPLYNLIVFLLFINLCLPYELKTSAVISELVSILYLVIGFVIFKQALDNDYFGENTGSENSNTFQASGLSSDIKSKFLQRFIIENAAIIIVTQLVFFYIKVILDANARNIFTRTGHAILYKNAMAESQKTQTRLINSCMPESIAKKLEEDLMNKKDQNNVVAENSFGDSQELQTFGDPSRGPSEDEQQFHAFKFLDSKENVSVLFADIVGFTNMSSKRTAAELVEALDDLFQRFDNLCDQTGCEKVATLGDCYYACCGCPTANDRHANNTVELGLLIIKSIREFCNERNDSVDMRVGVHTGKVMFGVVGQRKFKFDIFSDSVTLANAMETTGLKGAVHISQQTYDSLVFDDHNVRPYHCIGGSNEEIEQLDPPRKRDAKAIDLYTEITREEKDHNGFYSNGYTKATYFVFPKDQKGYETKYKPEIKDPMVAVANSSPTKNSPRKSVTINNEVAIREVHDDDLSKNKKGLQGKGRSARLPSLTSTDVVDFSDSLDIQSLISWKTREISPFSFFRNENSEACYKASFEFGNLHIDDGHTPTLVDNLRLLFMFDMIVALILSTITLILLFLTNITAPEELLGYSNFGNYWWYLFLVITILVSSVLCFAIAKNSANENLTQNFTQISDSREYKKIYVNKSQKKDGKSNNNSKKLPFTTFYFRHLVTFLIVIVPFFLLIVLANFVNIDNNCSNWSGPIFMVKCFFFQVLMSTILVPQVNSALKNVMILVTLIVVVFGACFGLSPSPEIDSTLVTGSNVTQTDGSDVDPYYQCQQGQNQYAYWEILVCSALLSLAYMSVNRELETSVRIAFQTRREQLLGKIEAEDAAKRTTELLLNIIPRHVVEELDKFGKYSSQHKCVAIIFAEVTNFSEFYEESFADGKECLRVLNEIISEFDSLLGLQDGKNDFRDIEKIKTIASTYMAASGLDPAIKRDPNRPEHVLQLLRFCIEIQKKMKEFNRDMIEFNFLLRIGFNVGEVIAGVVGYKKLLFDIWGDAVNIASRMYSTGEVGYIQMTTKTSALIEKHDHDNEFQFQELGNIFVKGKGMMSTCRLVQENVQKLQTLRKCEYKPQ